MTVLANREVMNEGMTNIEKRLEATKREVLELKERVKILETLNSGDREIIEVCAKALQREARQ
jgi:hypothetical protein